MPENETLQSSVLPKTKSSDIEDEIKDLLEAAKSRGFLNELVIIL